MNNSIIIAFLMGLIVSLIGYIFLIPKNKGNLEANTKNTPGMKFLSYISNEMYSSLPSGTFSKKRNLGRVEKLLVSSGNPWNMTAFEFFFFRFVCAFIGFVLSWPIFFFLKDIVAIPWWITAPSLTIFGFFIPDIKYKDQAKKRDLDFTRQLPEALDLMIISISSGVTFSQALKETIPNMRDGILKEEFENMSKKVESGAPLKSALDDFAERAPNDAIITFIKSLEEAIELNVPIIDSLKSRAEASREEFFSLVHQKVASLESKMMGILTVTLIPSLLIAAIAPSAFSLLGTLG